MWLQMSGATKRNMKGENMRKILIMIVAFLGIQLSANANTNYMNWYGAYSLDENNEIKVKLSSSFNFNNSPYNFRNSPYNFKNSPHNFDNNPYNFKNSPYNFNRKNGIYHNNGDSWGYYNNGNIFDNNGTRRYYFGN